MSLLYQAHSGTGKKVGGKSAPARIPPVAQRRGAEFGPKDVCHVFRGTKSTSLGHVMNRKIGFDQDRLNVGEAFLRNLVGR